MIHVIPPITRSLILFSTPTVWSPTTLIYTFITAVVVVVFLVLYRIVPACQRYIICVKQKLTTAIKSINNAFIMF